MRSEPSPTPGSASCAPPARRPISLSFAKLPPEVRRLARAKNLLNLTKANSRATVHRPAYLDYVGVKRFDEAGEPVAERRFLGLYTHTAYSASPWEIPVLRRKAQRVVERSGLPRGSHDYKALVEIIETYPRDELFQMSEDELFEIALGILHLGERQRVRLFVRRDAYGRFVSCLVYLPRERFNTTNRWRINEILQEAFSGTNVDFTARVSESVLARLHYVIFTPPGESPRRRRRRDRGTARRRDPRVDRRLSRGPPRGARRGARRAAPPAIRRGVPRRLPRRLLGAPRRRRRRQDREARSGRRPRPEPLRADRTRLRPPRVQGAPHGSARAALGRHAPAREHGRPRDGRAPVRGPASRRRADLDLRLRPSARRGRGLPGGSGTRDLPGRVRAHVARRGRERRLQPV